MVNSKLKIQNSKFAFAEAFRVGLVALAVAATVELLLWRTFSRIGVFIPKKGTFQDVYQILGLDIGVIALNFSVILAVAVLVLAALRLRELGEYASRDRALATLLRVATGGIIVVLGLSFAELFPRQEIPVISFILRLALLVSFGALGAIYWRMNKGWLARLFIVLVMAAYGLQILAKLVEDRFLPLPAGLNPNDFYIPLLLAGELAVLLNGLVVYPLYGGDKKSPARSLVQNWPAFLGAVVLVGIFLGLTALTVAESDIVPILGLYALGYTMQWPAFLYALALFFALYTLFFNLSHLGQSARGRAAAFGLLLLLVGGYQFNLSNQYLFALIGVLLLARPSLVEEF